MRAALNDSGHVVRSWVKSGIATDSGDQRNCCKIAAEIPHSAALNTENRLETLMDVTGAGGGLEQQPVSFYGA